jgi:hypothetical protein
VGAQPASGGAPTGRRQSSGWREGCGGEWTRLSEYSLGGRCIKGIVTAKYSHRGWLLEGSLLSVLSDEYHKAVVRSIRLFLVRVNRSFTTSGQETNFVYSTKKNLKWNFFKNIVFEIWNENFVLEFEKYLVIPPEGNENIWKKSFLKFETKFLVWHLKKIGDTTRGKWKKMKWRNHIFCLCHWKTTNNTTIPHMYTTLYQ